MTNLSCEHLVNRSARPNVRGALFQTHTGQKYAIASGMIPGAISSWICADMIDTTQHLDEFAALLQWFERRAQCQFRFFLRPPGRWNCSVWEENECGPQGRAGGGCGQFAGCRTGGRQSPERPE